MSKNIRFVVFGAMSNIIEPLILETEPTADASSLTQTMCKMD